MACFMSNKITDKGNAKVAYITAFGSIIVALITSMALIFVHLPNQREIAFDEGRDEGLINLQHQLQEAHNEGFSEGFADGEQSALNSEQVADYQSQISNLEAEIRTLETENENLQAQIDIFIERGELPIPVNADATPASITSLRNMTNIGDSLTNATVTRDNFRNTYSEVLHFERWDDWNNNHAYAFQALLDSRYTRIQGVVFVGYGETRDWGVDIRFEMDGRTYPLDTSTLDRITRPISIDIDLSGVNEFKIIVTRNHPSASDFVEIFFADFNFIP